MHSLSNAIVSTVHKNKIINTIELGEDDCAAKQDPQLFRADDKTILGYYFRYTFHPINEKKLFKNYTFIEYNNSIALLDGIGLCISSDNGKTFSKPEATNIKGYPLSPLLLKEGKILLTYGYRLKPYGIRARLLKLNEIKNLNDIIKNINDSKKIIIEDKMKNADCGYPSCINDDGDIICVYYGCNDKSKIRKIFMKKFILD